MPLTANTSQFSASLQWELAKTNTGFSATKQDGNLGAKIQPAAEQIYAAQFTIAASSTQTIDLRSFTNLAGESVTGTKLYTIEITVTGTNAKVKLEPGGSNPLKPFIDGTTPSVEVSADGIIALGSTTNPVTIDATHRNILLTNTGSANATVKVAAHIGTS